MSKSIFFFGEPQIKVSVRKVRNSKRLSLRVSSLTENVVLTAPVNTKHDVLLNFLKNKENWIRDKLINVSERNINVGVGEYIPIFGSDKRIEVCSELPNVVIDNRNIYVPSKVPKPSLVVENYLKNLAKEEFTNTANLYCDKLGVSYSKIKLRDPRSRWGSCSFNGNLMFSWRLIMAPKNIINYIVAHEVAHLKHFNHSIDFWTAVFFLFGPYENERKWLRTEGTKLHFYKFKG